MKKNAQYPFSSLAALLVAVFFLLFSAPAHAGCLNPVGMAGNMAYNADYNVPEYCDGNNWRAIGTFISSFGFTDVSGAAAGSTITSNTAILSGGMTNQTAVCGTGCTDIIRNGIDCGCTTLAGFSDGDTIAIKQVSSGSYGVNTTATVTVGTTMSNTWNVMTVNTANAFSFTDVVAQTVNTAITSNTISLNWVGGGTLTATCGTGCTGISINGAAMVAGPVSGITSGSTIAIRQTSSASNNTVTSATVTVGGTSTTWHVTSALAAYACTQNVTSLSTFTASSSQTIGYVIYGGGGGAMPNVSGTGGGQKQGTVAITSGAAISAYAGGGGGGVSYASGGGGSGWFGGGGGSWGGGGGGSSAIVSGGTTVLAEADGGAGAYDLSNDGGTPGTATTAGSYGGSGHNGGTDIGHGGTAGTGGAGDATYSDAGGGGYGGGGGGGGNYAVGGTGGSNGLVGGTGGSSGAPGGPASGTGAGGIARGSWGSGGGGGKVIIYYSGSCAAGHP